jgi:hypothetical protein
LVEKPVADTQPTIYFKLPYLMQIIAPKAKQGRAVYTKLREPSTLALKIVQLLGISIIMPG